MPVDRPSKAVGHSPSPLFLPVPHVRGSVCWHLSAPSCLDLLHCPAEESRREKARVWTEVYMQTWECNGRGETTCKLGLMWLAHWLSFIVPWFKHYWSSRWPTPLHYTRSLAYMLKAALTGRLAYDSCGLTSPLRAALTVRYEAPALRCSPPSADSQRASGIPPEFSSLGHIACWKLTGMGPVRL